jgi:DNA-binding beta-propeller fold protein YncE
VDLSRFGGGPASVGFDHRRGGIAAVAVQAEGKTDRGTVQFFDADAHGDRRGSVRVGVGPDNLTFTNDGKTLLVANEGEPTDDYSVDPEGTVSVIDVRRGAPRARVRTATFDGVRLRGPVRIFGPGASVAQDLEPEYIAVDPDDETAYVSCRRTTPSGSSTSRRRASAGSRAWASRTTRCGATASTPPTATMRSTSVPGTTCSASTSPTRSPPMSTAAGFAWSWPTKAMRA